MKYIIITIMSFMLTFTSFTKEIIIDMLNKRDDGQKMVYSQDIAKVALGDTIRWVPKNAGHNVEFLAGPDGFDFPTKSYLNKEFSMKFDIPGVYLYVCSPHSIMGMIGLVVVDNDTSNKDSIASYNVGGKGSRKLKILLDNL